MCLPKKKLKLFKAFSAKAVSATQHQQAANALHKARQTTSGRSSVHFKIKKEKEKIKKKRLYVLIVRILLLEHSHEVISTSFVYFVK